MTPRRYIVRLVAGFFREQDALTCDGVPLSEIARAAGTPVYVYSRAAV
jgi:diaminopimelate decarboxylase